MITALENHLMPDSEMITALQNLLMSRSRDDKLIRKPSYVNTDG